MLHLKLDLVACCNFSWIEAHNKMLLHRSIALDNHRKTLPPMDEDQRLALLRAPFKETTLFGGELEKRQEANTKRAATFTVFSMPIAPPVSYSSRPYVGQGKSSRKPSGRGKGQGRSKPSATITKPGQSKGQKTLTVSTPRTPTNVKWSRETRLLKPLGKI